MEKFLGLGLKNLLLIWLLFTVFTVMSKVIFTKYEINGVSQVFQAV